MARNSKIILSRGIKLDKNYQNCLTYSETSMLALCKSLKVAELNDCSFIREESSVSVELPYSVAMQVNYIAFQNTDYSLKWFFAFVNKVEYISEKTTKIYYTVDEFSTWFDYWSVKECFVVREHTNNDAIGANTIPEGLETGEYIGTGNVSLFDSGSSYICIGVTEILDSFQINYYISQYGGIYSGLTYFLFDEPLGATKFIQFYDNEGKGEAVAVIFMIPQSLCGNPTWFNITVTIDGNPRTTRTAHLDYTEAATLITTSTGFSSPTTIGSFTPKNKKMLVYPYCYFYITNNTGQEVIFHYEDFINNTAVFKTYGVVTPGCSIKTIPMNYKMLADSGSSINSYDSGIVASKFPLCSWRTDPYTNWLTQNGINIAGIEMNQKEASESLSVGSMILGAAMLGAGLMTGGAGLAMAGGGLAMAGASGMVNSMQANYKADMMPIQAKGSTNSGDITYSLGQCDVIAHKMTIREQYARCIDDFFTRFGYKTNRLKYPNQDGRAIFNYVEIGKSEIIGYPIIQDKSVPAESMEIINNIYRSGVTLWHDHSNIGNYSLDNYIIS